MIKAGAVYEPPFSNLHAGGPDALFAGHEAVIGGIFNELHRLRDNVLAMVGCEKFGQFFDKKIDGTPITGEDGAQRSTGIAKKRWSRRGLLAWSWRSEQGVSLDCSMSCDRSESTGNY